MVLFQGLSGEVVGTAQQMVQQRREGQMNSLVRLCERVLDRILPVFLGVSVGILVVIVFCVARVVCSGNYPTAATMSSDFWSMTMFWLFVPLLLTVTICHIVLAFNDYQRQ